MTFIKKILDIYSVPSPESSHQMNENVAIVLGDLHGNAIKLIYCLIFHGVASGLEQSDFDKLVRIYVTETKLLTSRDLEHFIQILAKIKFINKGRLILLGDLLADRGSNDYFTLKILELLSQHSITIEILLSNHDSIFIEATELQTDYTPQNKSVYNASMTHLQELIDLKLIKKEEVDHIATHIYKPMLKALTYTIDTNAKKFTTYSHAAIGLNTIHNLASVLDIPYRDSTVMQIVRTIEAINSEFQNHVKSNKVHILYQEGRESKDSSNSYADLTEYPFEFIMCNRLYHHIKRPKVYGLDEYEWNYVHGHDSDDPDFEHLNNTLGMSAWRSGGEYTAIITDCAEVNYLRNKGNIPTNHENLTNPFKAYTDKLPEIMNAFYKRGNTIDIHFIKNLYLSLKQNLTEYLEGFLPHNEFIKECQSDLEIAAKSIQKVNDAEKILNKLNFILKGGLNRPLQNNELITIKPFFFRVENSPVDINMKLKEAAKTLLSSNNSHLFK